SGLRRESIAMKKRLLMWGCLALGLVVPAPAGAQTPTPVPASAPAADPMKRIETAWTDLSSKWLSGGVSDSDYQAVKDALAATAEAARDSWPEAATVRQRLEAAIE